MELSKYADYKLIDNKLHVNAKVLLLPAASDAQQGDLFTGGHLNLLYTFSRLQAEDFNTKPSFKQGASKWVKMHIYVVTPVTNVNEVEWYIDDANQIRKAVTSDSEYWATRQDYNAIIATSNPSLKSLIDDISGSDGDPIFRPLPALPQLWVQQFIEMYNQIISKCSSFTYLDVLVECESMWKRDDGKISTCQEANDHNIPGKFHNVLKINLTDNTILVKVKKDYSQAEVDELLDQQVCRTTAQLLEKYKGYKSVEVLIESLELMESDLAGYDPITIAACKEWIVKQL